MGGGQYIVLLLSAHSLTHSLSNPQMQATFNGYNSAILMQWLFFHMMQPISTVNHAPKYTSQKHVVYFFFAGQVPLSWQEFGGFPLGLALL